MNDRQAQNGTRGGRLAGFGRRARRRGSAIVGGKTHARLYLAALYLLVLAVAFVLAIVRL